MAVLYEIAEGVGGKSTLCTLVTIMIIMDGPFPANY